MGSLFYLYMFYYNKNVRKKYIAVIEKIIRKYNFNIDFNIIIMNTNFSYVYGESIFYNTGDVIIKINFSLGDIEDTLIHELAHCIAREYKHNLKWRKTYRKLKENKDG